VEETQVTFSRRDQVADAALRVLGESGSRGLTHRAVDAAARVPQGTTSNYFRTRSSLLEAALALHVDLDTPPEAVLAEIANLALSDEEALDLMMGTMDRLLENSARSMLAARYELVLESSRHKDLHATFEPARERFVGLAEALLKARGCGTPREHGQQLVVVMDGVLVDALLAARTTLDRDQIRDLLVRQLETC
jgi:DNA-binding transcriptional regulator YbjK